MLNAQVQLVSAKAFVVAHGFGLLNTSASLTSHHSAFEAAMHDPRNIEGKVCNTTTEDDGLR